jgi:protein-tyrosine phosphatase
MYYLSNIPKMPDIQGVDIPNDFYWVLDEPAPLAGMQHPTMETPWEAFASAGFQKVVNLTDENSSYDPKPLNIAHAVDLEDLYGGHLPFDTDREERLIRETVHIILARLNAGEGVIVHCLAGRGRTGTVLGCVLKSMGYAVDEIIRDLSALHRTRGKPGWPESEWQSDLLHRF